MRRRWPQVAGAEAAVQRHWPQAAGAAAARRPARRGHAVPVRSPLAAVAAVRRRDPARGGRPAAAAADRLP
ncbi:hypothetical protein [Sphingomonas sp. Y38-1Y]|uniref:hypothetical protein n=1 Tax=Sphingomonas sp. Y38-1Y TaxID=3078265 RepID=UPI0028EF4253|nr:hypothetical protein [Sphingomonas sp. Y38-1Y]